MRENIIGIKSFFSLTSLYLTLLAIASVGHYVCGTLPINLENTLTNLRIKKLHIHSNHTSQQAFQNFIKKWKSWIENSILKLTSKHKILKSILIKNKSSTNTQYSKNGNYKNPYESSKILIERKFSTIRKYTLTINQGKKEIQPNCKYAMYYGPNNHFRFTLF